MLFLIRLKSHYIGHRTHYEGWIFLKSNASIIFALRTKYWKEIQIYYSPFISNSPGHVQRSAVMVYQVSLGSPGTTEHEGTRGTEDMWEHEGKRELMALMVPKVEKASRPRSLRETGNNVPGKMSMMGETMG